MSPRPAFTPTLPSGASAVAIAIGLVFSSTFAYADTDGVYGRLRADTVLTGELGGGVLVASDGSVRPLVAGTLRFRALDAGGFFAGYQYAFGASTTGRGDAFVLGAELRPVGFARIFSDLDHGPRFLDLTLDSIGLEMGAAWLRPGAGTDGGSGLGFVFGTGVDLPLFWRRGNGVLARIGVRWVHSLAYDAFGPNAPPENTVAFTLNLVGRGMFRAGLIGSP